MSWESISRQATSVLSTATAKVSPGGEKAGKADQAVRDAEAVRGRIEKRAYELYEQRGRHDGQALEDWFEAEQQLVGTAGK